MNHRNIKRTEHPGACKTCGNKRTELRWRRGCYRFVYHCYKRPIVGGKKPCEHYEYYEGSK